MLYVFCGHRIVKLRLTFGKLFPEPDRHTHYTHLQNVYLMDQPPTQQQDQSNNYIQEELQQKQQEKPSHHHNPAQRQRREKARAAQYVV